MKQKIIYWFKKEPKRLILPAIGLLGIITVIVSAIVSSFTPTDEANPPIIINPSSPPAQESTSDSLPTSENSVEVLPGQPIELKIPTQEELIQGGVREGTDHAMVLMRTYLGFFSDDSPRLIINDLRPLVSDELLSKMAEEIAARDWKSIEEKGINRVVEVVKIEIIAERSGIPSIIQVTADIYEVIENNYPKTPTNTGIWDISVEVSKSSPSFIATNIEQVG